MAGPAARHAGLDDAVGHLQGEDRVKADAVALQGFGLSDGTGYAVQDEAACAVGLGQPLLDDTDDDLIRNQLARVHIALGLQADGSALLDGCAQDIAGGDGGDAHLRLIISDWVPLPAPGAPKRDFHPDSPYSRKPL